MISLIDRAFKIHYLSRQDEEIKTKYKRCGEKEYRADCVLCSSTPEK